MDHTTWDAVERLTKWLDAETSPKSEESRALLRVMKIGEEFGEVAEALHGTLGANPRKGASHGWEDVHKELCDVIVTSMVALRSLTPDADQLLAAHADGLVDRVNA